MKDRIFSATDVDEALASAAASLGLPKAELRYVVLDAGSAGGRGLKPTPARIAILLQEPGRTLGGERDERPGPRARHSEWSGARGDQPHAVEPIDDIREVVRALASAGGLELDVETEQTEDAFLVHLRGAGAGFLLEPSGRAEVLLALEHLLQRRLGSALFPLPLRVRCEGFREQRDQALAEEARQIAAAVLKTGEARTMAPLNAYERRVVHVALQEEPGVTTFSTGEGKDRRVTVAPRPAPAPAVGDDAD